MFKGAGYYTGYAVTGIVPEPTSLGVIALVVLGVPRASDPAPLMTAATLLRRCTFLQHLQIVSILRPSRGLLHLLEQ